jgi:hypothetical protein
MVRIFDAKIAINYIDDCEERFIRNKHGAFVDRLKSMCIHLVFVINPISI